MTVDQLKEKLISILSEANDINHIYVLTPRREYTVVDFEVDSVGHLRVIIK